MGERPIFRGFYLLWVQNQLLVPKNHGFQARNLLFPPLSGATCWFSGVYLEDHPRTCKWLVTFIDKPFSNGHLEGVPQPNHYGNFGTYHGPINHIPPSWDDPPSNLWCCWPMVTSHLEDLQGLERDPFCSDLVPLVSKKKHGVYMAFFFWKTELFGSGEGELEL